MDIYTLREQCIFCNSNIDKTYFEEDKYLYISSNICNDITNTKINITKTMFTYIAAKYVTGYLVHFTMQHPYLLL
jgi:hydroxymethylglutaryl-CoA reductase